MIRAARRLLALTALLVAGLSGPPAVLAADPPTVLITGANRGIGLEFAKGFAARGWTVVATTRRPTEAAELNALALKSRNVRVEALDITSADSVAELARRWRGRPIDVLVNNAALLERPADQQFGKLDYALFERSFAVNATGPMRVTEALIDNVAASQRKTVLTLSSAAGSTGMVTPPAVYYPYRASKAALNMLMHNLAIDLKSRGVTVLLVNPGLVDTRGILTRKPGDPVPEEFASVMPAIEKGIIKLQTTAEAVTAMLALLDRATPEQSGQFLNYDGKPLPW
jgi:NAD(P)-dependent dehydrogenase (short-subunit alcohol dehydrogenase family)